MLLKNSESCVLNDGVANGVDFELVRALCEVSVGVDPG
jgi:hypothetical protein